MRCAQVLIVLAAIGVAQTRAFKIGDQVESEYAGGWSAGVVIEILSGNNMTGGGPGAAPTRNRS